MAWNALNNRGEILRNVIATADLRLDGILPFDVRGARENFRDELDLLSAVMLKWHARLSGNVERALATQPLDTELAVATAWRRTADEMPGVRRIIDHYGDVPTDDYMRQCLERAAEKEHTRLALAVGSAQDETAAAIRAGERIEVLARTMPPLPPVVKDEPARPRHLSLVDKLRDFVAA